MADEDTKKEMIRALVQVQDNLVALAKYISDVSTSVQGNRAAVSAVVEVVDDNEERALAAAQRDAEKEVFTHAYSKSQNYAKIIIIGFYGTYFGLYGIVSSVISDQRLIASVLLMILSASVLALFEVVQSVKSNWTFVQRISKADKALSIMEVGDELGIGQRQSLISMRNSWIVALIFTLGSAIVAVGLFVTVLAATLIDALPPAAS